MARRQLLFVCAMLAGSPAIGCGDDSADSADDGDAGDGDGAEVSQPELGPPPSELPEVEGTCPTLAQGRVDFDDFWFEAHVADDAADTDGPMVFYWHGRGSQPAEALVGLGQDVIDEILAEGGMVAAMEGKQSEGLLTGPDEWRTGDFDFADRVLACAIEQVGIDTRRIHSIGMSAGGLQTSQMAYQRSDYIASVVAYSGGGSRLRDYIQDPDANFASLLFHGGPQDIVTINFKDETEKMAKDLADNGQFVVVCDHGMRHTIPPGGAEAALRFFRDHPYGVGDSPYVAAGLPPELPDYCVVGE